jgi:hypothetical protein
MQHLLARAKWDADGMRDDVRGYVAEHLGEPEVIWCMDLCRPGNYAEVRAG